MSDGDTILEAVLKRNAALRARTVDIAHPADPAQVFRAAVPTDGQDIARLRDAAQKNKAPGWEFRFARALIAQYVETILEAGDPLELDGEPVNFRSKTLQERLGATSAADAVFAYLASDGYVATVANDLVEESGFGAEAEDPTGI